MKKIIFSLSALLVALSFSNCSKDEAPATPSIEKTPFTIHVLPESRTSNDGMNTVWDEGDAVSVFHAVTGSTEYGTNDEFTCTADEVTEFKGYLTEALEEGQAYDWYVLYPYSSYVITPKEPKKGYLPVGSERGDVQTQNGNSDMAHIAGPNYPLFGNVANVAADSDLSLTLSHVSSLIEFKVTNSTSEPMVVEGIDFTSTEDIIGTYYIDFSGENAVLTGSGSGYVNSTAKLVVAEGEELAVGESATFYMGVKPHEVANGELKVVVKTSAGDVEKTLSGVNTTFKAGKMKTLSVEIDAFKAFVDYSGTYVIMNTQVDNGSYFYMSNLSNNASGTNRKAVDTGVKDLATITSLNAIPNMSNAARWIIQKVEDENVFTIQSADNQQYIYGASASSNNAKLTSNVEEAEKVTIDYDEESDSYTINSTAVSKSLSLNSSSTIFAFYGSGRNALKLVAANDPLLDMAVSTDVNLTADAANGTVEITLANNEGWMITVSNDSEGNWLTTTLVDNTVNYSATANAGEAREATVTLTATKGTESKVVTFVVSQDKATSATALELTFSFTSEPDGWPSANSNANGQTAAQAGNYVYTLDGVEYTFSLSKNGLGVFYHTGGHYLATLTANQAEAIGLPAIADYKLTKVVASNTSNASTSFKAGISSDATSASYVTGGEVQTWRTTSSSYTYTLSGTAINTMYYLYCSNKNGQISTITLTYEK